MAGYSEGHVQDTTGYDARERADALDHQAAADARASYYAHPALHLSSYSPQERLVDPDRVGPRGVGALNAPAVRQEVQALRRAENGITTNVIAEREGTNEGKKEEEGGKEYSAPPTGLDKGALEYGGEAGGTHSSPGPSAALVQAAVQAEQGNLNGARVNGAVNLPDDRAPGQKAHWSVRQAMNPHLQLMCGPLLSYHTVDNGIWYGAVMVVTADKGSVFEPAPTLSLQFFPYVPPASGSAPPAQEIIAPQELRAQRIHTYEDREGPCSFWRFLIQIPIQESCEVSARYRLNHGAELRFVVPRAGQNLRWTSHSCNGFSSGVEPDDFKGERFGSGYDPVWEDMLEAHERRGYHCMVGGGDQIYCDALTREPELQSWITAPNREQKLNHPLTEEMRLAIDRFYFNHYCKIFRSNAFGRANSTIPMVNMLDDHDLIDGFGTYDDETQASPVFSHIGSRGYFWFLLFQLFTADDVDGILHPLGQAPIHSLLIGNKGPWTPYYSHHLSVYLGPQVHLLAVDCRAERKLTEIIQPNTYQKLFGVIRQLPPTVEHLVVLLGVPIAYPRMSFLEHFLDFKWNPLNILARRNALGLGGMVNKFNQASELLDDLNDHWCANTHKKERNWLVLEMQRIALEQRLRITFLSGDVHLAAVGVLKTHHAKVQPAEDHRYMLNVVTSAIVNTPPPAGAAKMVAILGGNKHRTLHKHQTDETMIPLFKQDTDGSKMRRAFVQPRRNYTSITYQKDGNLAFEIRVEKSQGEGTTVPYLINAPPPRFAQKGGVAVADGVAPGAAANHVNHH